MARLRLLHAATLLLLMLQLLQTVEGTLGVLNLTDCDFKKACWVSGECFKVVEPERPSVSFHLRQTQTEYDNVIGDCKKYFIVEPDLDFFTFELSHDELDNTKKVDIRFKNGELLSCEKHLTSTDQSDFLIEDQVPNTPESDPWPYTFCRFKVSRKIQSTETEFYSDFQRSYSPATVSINEEGGKSIIVSDYNNEHFEIRVPCKRDSVFIAKGELGDEYNILPLRNVESGVYSCEDGYILSYKDNKNDQNFKTVNYNVKIACKLGVIKNIKASPYPVKIFSAKCARNRNTLCEEVCSNCVGPNTTVNDAGVRSMKCSGHRFMVLNDYQFTTDTAKCSMKSTPDDQQWEWKDMNQNLESNQIGMGKVNCTDKLECNNMMPFTHCGEGDECKKANFSDGKYTCESGFKLMQIDTMNTALNTITCDTDVGQWMIDGKLSTRSRNATKLIKIGCVDQTLPTTTHASPAAAKTDFMVFGIGLDALILLLLIILLLYCIFCRKGRKAKDEPSKPEPPTSAPPPKTDSSVVEQPMTPPAPIAPVSTESNDAPAPYSGKRVQMINMSQERLREIEPDEDATKEFSARDKTDSEKSQVSQVGGTTDAGRTVSGRGTEATNEVSRTIVPGDDTRSDVSRGRNSTMGDQSETGPGGNTPTIGEAEKKAKRTGGPKVQFRDRVSYETETKTRDRTTTVGSMHTAPEQPAPVVDRTQAATADQSSQSSAAEARKKGNPSRLNADAARKAFGTRTAQNTRETNDDPNRSQDSTVGNRSRVTDISRTG